MIFLLVSSVWCLILFQMSALGGLLRQPNWRNLEEAGRLITVGGNGAGSFRVFEDWRKARNKLVLKEPYLGEPVYEKALSTMSDEELDDVLGKFVAEVRKEGQEEYPGKTLYEMICCIQAYFRIECKRNRTLVDKKPGL